MSRPKQLFLTCVSTVINEKGEETLKKVNGKQEYDDDNAPEGSLGYFRRLGIRPPKDMEEEDLPEVDEDGMVELKEDEIDYIFDDVILELADFSCAVDSQTNGYTTVYTKSSMVITVAETTDEIFDQIYLLKQNWFEKIYDNLQWRFKRFFNKKHDIEL